MESNVSRFTKYFSCNCNQWLNIPLKYISDFRLHTCYLIYLTLHWPFLINLRQCSLSINSYEYSCHTILAGLFNALFTKLMYEKVAQWLKFWAVNHDIMGSNPAETVYNFYFFFIFIFTYVLLNHLCCRCFAYFPCSLFICNHYNAHTT